MVIDDQSLFGWIFGGIGAIFMAGTGFLMNRQIKFNDKILEKTEILKDSIHNHENFSSNNYIKKDVVDRIHERLDKTAEKDEINKLNSAIVNIQTDIKTLLSREKDK